MKNTSAALAVLALLLVSPAFADKKLDDAVAKADEQLAKGKVDEAQKTMEKATNGSSLPEAHTAMSRFLVKLGKFEEAAVSAKKAVDLSAAAAPAVKADALAQHAWLDLQAGSSKEALGHAQEAAQLNATGATLAVLAQAQVKTGNATAALETARKAVAAGGALASVAEGDALLALGKKDEALASYRKAAEGKGPGARTGVARALLASGKAAEAAAEAKKATEEEPKSAEAFAVWGLAIWESTKNWNEAIAQAQQGNFLNPKNQLVAMIVGQLFEVQGNLDQAVQAYRKALEADPSNPAPLAKLADLEYRKGNLKAAEAEIAKILQLAPGNGEANLTLGRILAQKKDFAGALAPLQKAAAALPGNAEAQAYYGTVAQYNNKTEEAVGAYKKAVELDAKNLDYRTTYGLLLGVAKKYEESAAQLKQVVGTPGYKDTDGYVNLGWLYNNMDPKKPEEAIAAYKKALELDPKTLPAAIGLAKAHQLAKHYDESIKAYEQAIAVDDAAKGEAYFNNGWNYYFKKDFAKAREQADKAKAEGRSMASLLENIDKIEKLMKEGKSAEQEIANTQAPKEEGPSVHAIGDQLLKGKTPAARASAARQMRQFGAQGVPWLAAALSDADLGVREATVDTICALGRAAREASPQVQFLVSAPLDTNPLATPQQMQLELREGDLKKKAKGCLDKMK